MSIEQSENLLSRRRGQKRRAVAYERVARLRAYLIGLLAFAKRRSKRARRQQFRDQ